MGRATIEIEGLKPFRRALRQLDDKQLRNGLTKVYRDLAKMLRSRVEAAAPGGVKRAIGHKANQRGAFVTIRPVPEYALGVFLGAKARFGWYSAGRYSGSQGRQFEPWVGNQWDPGEAGSMPYFIGPAFNASVDEALELLADGFTELAEQAFPSH